MKQDLGQHRAANSEEGAIRAQGWGQGHLELKPKGTHIMREEKKHTGEIRNSSGGGHPWNRRAAEAAMGCLGTPPFLGLPQSSRNLTLTPFPEATSVFWDVDFQRGPN